MQYAYLSVSLYINYINIYLYLHIYQGFPVGSYPLGDKPLVEGRKLTHTRVLHLFIKLPLLVNTSLCLYQVH